MASLGHVVVGLAVARGWPSCTIARPSRRTLVVAMAGLAVLSLLPDADVVGFKFGIAYTDPWGHRGATHSIVFALFCGAIAFIVAQATAWKTFRGRIALTVFLVVVSHPLLDALTDGGHGVALWWPLSDARIFSPWRPLQVAPIGRRFFTTTRGFQVAATEFAFFLPALLFALWPRRRTPHDEARDDEALTLQTGSK